MNAAQLAAVAPDPGGLAIFVAQAAPAGAPAGGGLMSSFTMMAVIVAIFYFLLIRPQQKEQKKHQELLTTLKKGDQVVTSAGIHGKVHAVKDESIVLEIADKIRVTFDKPAIKRKLDAAAEA